MGALGGIKGQMMQHSLKPNYASHFEGTAHHQVI